MEFPGLPVGFVAVANRRIAFLSRFADLALGQAKDGNWTALNDPQGTLAAAEALTEAASLAFAVAQTQRGRDLANHAYEKLDGLPSGDGPFLRTLLLGTLLGRITIALLPLGISIDSSSKIISWPDAPTLLEAAGALIAAALANHKPSDRDLTALSDSISAGLASQALAAAPEADTLPAYELRRDSNADGEARAAFGALHQRYAARLRLLAPGKKGWETRRVHAELIDWPLLALHVGLHRRCISTTPYVLAGAGPVATAGRYIDALARELAGLTPEGWWRST